MKLFVATNELTSKTPNIKLLEKTLKTAVENTSLDVYLIFDGNRNVLSLPPQVNVIEHKHRCFEAFKKQAKINNPDNPDVELGWLTLASGTYLRTEIPYLCKKLGFEDEYVLYTDYDVYFESDKDYSDLENLRPPYFACAPEFYINHWDYISAGVMLMNVNSLFSDDEMILNEINTNVGNHTVVDQTMYNNMYRGRITKLPLEYNWKPYWGINPKAKIIHYHGAKPTDTEERKLIPIIDNIYKTNPEGIEYYFNKWYNL